MSGRWRRAGLLRVGVAAASLALLPAPGGAQQGGGGDGAEEMRRPPRGTLLPGVGAADPRRRVEPEAEPWRALGRVQTELGGRCTGVMVGPRTVLTAAHCLAAPRAGGFVQPGSVHFLLGYHLGARAAHARVARYTVGPGFTPGAARMGPAGADWALLTLERPIGAESAGRVLPLLREAPAPRTPLMLGGYQQDRPEALVADTGCRALGLERRASGHVLLVHDCAGTRGASGAPLLARRPDGAGWGVAGVAVAVSAEIALGRAVPAAAITAPP